MFHAVTWFIVLGLLALWSVIAWSLNALGAWALSTTATSAAAASESHVFKLPEWLAPWVPTELAQAMATVASNLSPLVVNLPEQVLVFSNGLAWVVGAIWLIGTLLLVGAGLLAHTLRMRLRRPGLPTFNRMPAFVPN